MPQEVPAGDFIEISRERERALKKIAATVKGFHLIGVSVEAGTGGDIFPTAQHQALSKYRAPPRRAIRSATFRALVTSAANMLTCAVAII